MDLQKQINRLFEEQMQEWEQLSNSVNQLKQVKTRTFTWGNEVTVDVQFNPARMISTGAKTDVKTIEKRACFLCEPNRPSKQRGISFLDKYIILCNPYPILQNHLTIPLHSHVPQLIRKKVGEMLLLAEQLPDYVVFYNGAKCGVSAPDHFHLQAGLKLPVLLQRDNELRSCMTIETESREEAEEDFESVYQYLHSHQPDEEEPMLNIIAYMENGRYVLSVFPRNAHRPSQYYAEGKRQLLISPGALDMAGLMITVREEDFEKITKNDVEDIYSQVSKPII